MADLTPEQRAEAQRAADLAEVMQTDAGRRFITDLVLGTAPGQGLAPSYDSAIKDGICAALHTAYHEGRREAARSIADRAQKANPVAYLEMMTSHFAELLAEARSPGARRP